MIKYPTVTIVTLTYNVNPDIWLKVLESIRMQDYPAKKIDHLVMDGGSTNNSLKIFQKYGYKIHNYPNLLNESEARKGRGIKLATGEIVAFIEADNILPNKSWFKEMVQPFIDYSDIVGTFSMYNSFEPDMPILTRYCALFGMNDPAVYYLGKSEKLTRFQSKYHKGKLIIETKKYTVVKFNQYNLPTLGDNGHFVRRDCIMKVNENPDQFLHTDAFANLLKYGSDTYAAVNNSIIHYTGSDIRRFLQRRSDYKKIMYDQKRGHRQYLIFNPNSIRDQIKLITFIFFSLTFIEPIIESIYGYVKYKDNAWLLHPFLCTITLFAYAQSELQFIFKNILLNINAKFK
jgi:glycosyltransferase involved in cell wall biosynthesis